MNATRKSVLVLYLQSVIAFLFVVCGCFGPSSSPTNIISSVRAESSTIDDTIRVVPAAVLYHGDGDGDEDEDYAAVVLDVNDDKNKNQHGIRAVDGTDSTDTFDEKLRIIHSSNQLIDDDSDDDATTTTTTTTNGNFMKSRTNYMHRTLHTMMTNIAATSKTTTTITTTAKPVVSMKFIIHPNGKASCRETVLIVGSDSSDASSMSSSSSFTVNKYQMEATFTEYIANRILQTNIPHNENYDDDDEEEDFTERNIDPDCWSSPRTTATTTNINAAATEPFYNYCDMGTQHTVIQKDHHQLIRVGSNSNSSSSSSTDPTGTLPCRFYTKEGVRIVSMEHLETLLINERQKMKDVTTDSTITTATTSIDMDGSAAAAAATTTTTAASTDTTESPPTTERTATSTTKTDGSNTMELHLYAVPAGRVFMFAPSYVGEIFTLSHIVLPKPPRNIPKNLVVDVPLPTTTNNNNKNSNSHANHQNKSIITLEVLSVVPPIFDLHNFFSIHESNQLITKALAERSETYKFHRSTTGTSTSNVYDKRTSENAWDTHGATAQVVKRRSFQLLGFDEYQESMTDGLQILRYNLTTAYVNHLDYLEDNDHEEAYDYDTSNKGGNRFATILLYFTTLNEGDGGETVFPRVLPPSRSGADEITQAEGLRILREQGDTYGILKEDSWEERMTVLCRTKFSVQTKALRAVLFYSQFPNGTVDPLSYHGGCPVLRGTKLAANLWTWSAIRPEYDGGPIRDGVVLDDNDSDSDNEDEPTTSDLTISAIFKNSGKDERFRNVELYFDETGFFGKLGFDDSPISVNTYSGHVWNIKDEVSKVVLQTFIVSDGNSETQIFEV